MQGGDLFQNLEGFYLVAVYEAIDGAAATLSPVQAVFVLCNLVYNPSTPVNQCLYAFSGTGYGVGEPVVINPATALWIKSVDGSFASIIITLTDQRSLPLNQVDTAATFLISYRKRK